MAVCVRLANDPVAIRSLAEPRGSLTTMAAAGNQERRIVAQPDEATIHSLEAAARADASALTPTGIARVGDLFVREDDRNRAIGSALLTSIPTAADERGYEPASMAGREGGRLRRPRGPHQPRPARGRPGRLDGDQQAARRDAQGCAGHRRRERQPSRRARPWTPPTIATQLARVAGERRRPAASSIGSDMAPPRVSETDPRLLSGRAATAPSPPPTKAVRSRATSFAPQTKAAAPRSP
jgi:GNAT superfamily N-acetyltransferase